jgi:hypothetical protein
MHKTGEMETPTPASKATAELQLNEAYQVYPKTKKKATNWCNTFLDSLVKAKAKADGKGEWKQKRN